MRRNTIDIIRNATADLGYFRLKRLIGTATYAVTAVMMGFFSIDIPGPPASKAVLLGSASAAALFGVLNFLATTGDIRNARRVLAHVEAGSTVD